MTEPKLIVVLVSRFNVDREKLESIIGKPDFAKRLFHELLDARYAHALLIDIFNITILDTSKHVVGLCESEKAIVKEVKSWPVKSEQLWHVCKVFLPRDLEVDSGQSDPVRVFRG